MTTKWDRPGPRHEATLQLLQTAEMLWHGSRLLFARWNLSPSQFNVLNLLRSHTDGLSQADLSRELIMHRSNATGLIDRLEQRGFVRRRETPGDRRAYRVVLTEAGQQLIQDMLPAYYRAADEIWGSFPLKRTRQIAKDLHRLREQAEQLMQTIHQAPAGL